MPPLNPQLYRALEKVYGVVTISNQGQPLLGIYSTNFGGKQLLSISSRGEAYVVRCPFCHDTTGKLYINHRWGVRDPKNHTKNLWLAKCFLSDCLASWVNREELFDRLDDYALACGVGKIPFLSVTEASPSLVECRLPEDFELLTDLPSGHSARRYVRQRGFSPKKLVDLWGIGFSADEYRDIPGRLVIPLHANLGENNPQSLGDPRCWRVVGYQGRLLSEPEPRQPKYLTSRNTPKSRLLYGLDRVSLGTGPVVVMEGPTDVWQAGPGAVAIMGKEISPAQCRLLRSIVPHRDIVVLLDPEAYAEAQTTGDRIRDVLGRDLINTGARGRVVVGELPDDRDPGECSYEEIWDSVRQALCRTVSARQDS